MSDQENRSRPREALWKPFGFTFGLICAAAMLASACGTDPTPTPEPTPTPAGDTSMEPTGGASEFPAPEGVDQAEWDALVTGAQEEGRLVTVGGRGIQQTTAMKEYFGNKFGIKVSIGAGSLNDQINRVIAEQSFGRYDVDHLTTGGPIVDLLLVPANAVEPLQDWLFLPEVIGGDNWFGGELLFNDVEQKYNVIYTGSLVNSSWDVWFNTDNVSMEEAEAWTSWRDIYDNPKFYGKIIDSDPLGRISGSAIIEQHDNPGLGPEYLQRAYGDAEVGVTWSSDERFIADSCAAGTFWICFGGANEFEFVRSAGGSIASRNRFITGGAADMGWEPIAFLEQVSPSASRAVMIPKNPPHPNVTRLWANWILSREGQTVMQEEGWHPDPILRAEQEREGGHGQVSLRVDVPPGNARPEELREPGVDYLMIKGGEESARRTQELWEWREALHREGYGR